MLWRPPNWKNPYKIWVLREKQVRDGTTTETSGYEKRTIPDPIFEAGADAMLKEVLKYKSMASIGGIKRDS